MPKDESVPVIQPPSNLDSGLRRSDEGGNAAEVQNNVIPLNLLRHPGAGRDPETLGILQLKVCSHTDA